MLQKLTVRVYGLLINNRHEILLSDEIIRGNKITKFPGGGLQLGEGPAACLIRELKEETGMDVDVVEHFYTTDFFQQSYFDDETQVISIYYLVQCSDWENIATIKDPFAYSFVLSKDAEAMRWASIASLHSETALTLPIDKKVAMMLQEKYG